MKRIVQVLILLTSVLACSLSGCSPKFDAKKFDNLHKAALALNSLLKSGGGYEKCGEAVKAFAVQISAAVPKAESQKEKELLRLYADLADMYRDGLLLWKYQIEGGHFGFIPKGLIYVGQDVEPVVKKYNFRPEPHTYKPTGQVWKSIPEESIGIVWENAGSQLDLIEHFSAD